MENKYIKKTYSVNWNSLSMVKNWLEEMALKGYKLVEVKGGNSFIFEIIKPTNIYYAVEVLPQGSIFDTHPSGRSEEYIEYCENSGWNYVDSTGDIYFFSAEKEDTVAIQTDEKLKFQTVKKAIFKGKIISSIVCIIMAIISLIMIFTLQFNTILLSPMMFETIFIWLLVFILHSYNLIRFYVWVNRAKKIINGGGKMPEVKVWSYWLYMIIFVIFTVIHSLISVVLSVKYGDVVGYMVPVIWIIMYIIMFISKRLILFAEKNRIGRVGNRLLQLIALPAICITLISAVCIAIVITDKEERSDITIDNEDVSIFFSDKSYENYKVETSSMGKFILAMDTIYITGYNESDSKEQECSLVIYRTDNQKIIERLIKNVNKFGIYNINFEIEGANRREEEGVVIYEYQNSETDYKYLIYNTDTILCLYSFDEKLNAEQFEYLKETVLGN